MTKLLLAVCIVLIAASLLQTTDARPHREKRNKDPGEEKPFSFQSRERKEFRNNILPETLLYEIEIEGFPVFELDLVLSYKMNVPESVIGNLARDSCKGSHKREKTVGIYTDLNGHGSFACEASTGNDWQLNCDISGLFHFNGTSCYIGGEVDEAVCFDDTTEGHLECRYPPDVVRPNSSVDMNQTADLLGRDRRSIHPSPGFKVVEVAFALDAAFMKQFYDRHRGNTAAAEKEADLFVVLFVNEMNVFYASVKEVSDGQLDLYVYPAAIVYPGYGYDFRWASNYNDGGRLQSSTASDEELRLFFNSEFTTNHHDFAMALTGLDLIDQDGSDGLLGYAFLGSVCVDSSNTLSKYKYAINEFTISNVAWVASHELGHALGATTIRVKNALPGGT
ncbi:hypothetical protein DPMN_018178 [Dreissena polymorpha]|uniref:Peptidase M12B domain-containing protein n=2 Tax=Dreissena polymorpha TaxID=45954 RepID=A0A9D4NCR4_DREPO|nr:hypothetical protein DPMN_018178 [Dreissena polymorpha]